MITHVKVRRDGKDLVGTIVMEGQDRWSRRGRTGQDVADQLLRIYPALSYVKTSGGLIEDTGCLTLGECIEAVA